MPLTEKGEKIKHAMSEQYGEKKGEQVFYASRNAGKIKGVDGEPGSIAAPAAHAAITTVHAAQHAIGKTGDDDKSYMEACPGMTPAKFNASYTHHEPAAMSEAGRLQGTLEGGRKALKK